MEKILNSFLLLIIVFCQSKYCFTQSNNNSSNALITLSETWKNNITKEFDTNNALLQQIIMDGEKPDQISDFLDRFKNQKKWFEKTLSTTKYMSDQNYNKILTKNAQIDSMATSIKKVDAILEKLELNSEQKKQIRLNVLYEIGSTPQPIPDETIRQITINIIGTINDKSKLIAESNLTQILYSQTFENLSKEMMDLHITNKELLNKTEQNQKIVSTLNSQLTEMKKQNKESENKIDFLEQVYDYKVKEQSKMLTKKIDVNNKQSSNLINKIEEESKQKIELEIEILEKARQNNLF